MSTDNVKPGDRLENRFLLQEKLGSGGFGAVWSAIDLQDNSTIAVKILHTNLVTSNWVLERFQTESDILTRFHHPRVAHCIYAGTSQGLAFMCMELVGGKALHDELAERSNRSEMFSIEEVSSVLDQIGATLDYAHSLGIVHRDLKPKNIMIMGQNDSIETKLLDFGIAKVLYDTATDATTVGRLLGSLLYLSPEQALCEGISHRADIFSLGTVIFELLTLRRAWAWDPQNDPLLIKSGAITKDEMNNHLSILKRIVSAPRPHASKYRSDLSPSISNVLLRALASDPQNRFESAGEFAAAFRGAARITSMTGADAIDESLPEASLTHVVDPTRISDTSPVVPSDHDEKDLVSTRIRPSGEILHDSPVNLASNTPLDPERYASINVPQKAQLPQTLVLLIGLFIGVLVTYLLSRPPPNNAVPLAVTPAPVSTSRALTAVNKPLQEKKTKAPEPTPAITPTPAPAPAPTPKTTARRDPSPAKTAAPKTAPNPFSSLDKALAAVRASPDDFDRIEKFGKRMRSAIKKKLTGQNQTSLLRRLELAELQANIDELEACLKDFKKVAK